MHQILEFFKEEGVFSPRVRATSSFAFCKITSFKDKLSSKEANTMREMNDITTKQSNKDYTGSTLLFLNSHRPDPDDGPSRLEKRHFNHALCLIPDEEIKFGLQLIAKFHLTGSEAVSIEAQDCLFDQKALRIKFHGGELLLDLGAHEEWLRSEIKKGAYKPADRLVQVSTRLLATALKTALQEAGYPQYQNPYTTLRLLRNMK